MLATQLNESITQQIATRDSELLSLLQNIPSLASASSDSTHSDENTPQEYQANATSTNTVQLEILKLLKELSTDIKQTKAVPRQHQSQKTPDNKNSPLHADTSKYCWTHGAGNHSSSECKRRAQGHKHEAVFTNKLGGSKAYCN